VGTWRDFAKKKGKKVRACVLPARVRARRVLPSAQADSTRVCLQLHQRACEHVSSVLDRFVGAGDAHAPVGTCSVLVRRVSGLEHSWSAQRLGWRAQGTHLMGGLKPPKQKEWDEEHTYIQRPAGEQHRPPPQKPLGPQGGPPPPKPPPPQRR